jgi:hypothetical protein
MCGAVVSPLEVGSPLVHVARTIRVMPEDPSPPTDSPPPGETPHASDSGSTPESLHERIRNLRLWADHLEARLARKTEQADEWRMRADERKRQIDELQTGSTGRIGKRVSAVLKRSVQPTKPEATETHVATQRAEVEAVLESRSDPRLHRLVHPTIRIGIATLDPPAVPPLLRRMNATFIRASSSADQVRAVDMLVTVGPDGARLAQTAEATREWIENGNPTVAVGYSMQGHASADLSDLAYFDEDDDIFGIGSKSHRSEADEKLQPTLFAISQGARSEWLASIMESVSAEILPHEQERLAATLLRQFRDGSSARAVGERFLQTAGVLVPHWRREALAVLVSKRPDFVVEATDRIAKQTYRPLRVAVGLHGAAMEAENEVRQLLAETDVPHQVSTFDGSIPQGECLNALVEAAPGDVILKIDDDDWYSPVFITDMVGALEYSGAAIVGKAAAFVRLRDGRFVLLRTKSYREVDHVVGPTITAHRWAWESVRFPNRFERVDSKFLQAARSAGLRVVSHHPWDFCVIRHDRGHSWTASDDYFLSTGSLVDLDWKDIRTG